jgi:protein O-mannosyl-transferase
VRLGRRTSPAAVGLALLVVAFVIFVPALAAPFDFDDGPAIVANQTIRRLWPPDALLHAPIGTPVSGRPIANYSFAVDYAINRWLGVAQTPSTIAPRETVAFHVTNVLLHVITALLLFALIRRTMRDGRIPDAWRGLADPIALTVTALWLVHPIQSEAVDYITQRTELLVSLFYVGTLYAAIRAAAGGVWWSVCAVTACLLGMASKEVMITAPLVVVLYDRAFMTTSWREPWMHAARRRLYIALLATGALSIVLVGAGARAGTAGFGVGMPWYGYLYSQAWAIVRYLQLVVWPVGLTIDYGREPVRGFAGVPGAILLTVAAACTIAAWTKEHWRWAGFLGAWIFLLLAPSSSIVPVATEIAAERRIHLALAPALVLVVVAGVWLLNRPALRHVARRPMYAVALVAALCIALGAGTFARSALYRDPVALWSNAVARVPDNVRAYDNLAAAELRLDPPQLATADSVLRRGLSIDPTYVPSWNRRAAIAIRQSRLADAATMLHRTLALAPDDSTATDELGRLYLAADRPDSAIPLLRRTAAHWPSSRAAEDLGTAYLELGALDSAAAVLERAVRLDPSNPEALTNLGGALVELDSGREALPYLEYATSVSPQSGFALAVLSLALAQASQPAASRQRATAAVDASPNDEAVDVFVGRAMATLGDQRAASTYLAKAVQLAPNDPQALARLAMARAALGNFAGARALVRRALIVAPGDGLVRTVAAKLGLE